MAEVVLAQVGLRVCDRELCANNDRLCMVTNYARDRTRHIRARGAQGRDE